MGNVLVEIGILLFQCFIFSVGCREGYVLEVGNLSPLERHDAVLHIEPAFTLASYALGRHQAFKLHDEVQFHGIVGGIIAPVVTKGLKQVFFETHQLFRLNFAVHKSTNIYVGLGVVLIRLIFLECLIKLLDGVFPGLGVEHAYANVTRADNPVIVVLRPFACAISRKVFPSAALDADAAALKDVVEACNQSLKTVAVVH